MCLCLGVHVYRHTCTHIHGHLYFPSMFFSQKYDLAIFHNSSVELLNFLKHVHSMPLYKYIIAHLLSCVDRHHMIAIINYVNTAPMSLLLFNIPSSSWVFSATILKSNTSARSLGSQKEPQVQICLLILLHNQMKIRNDVTKSKLRKRCQYR